DVLEFPRYRRYGLVAHLLGEGDAIGFRLSIGVIGTDTDKDAALPADQDELNLAAGVTAADLDAILRGQPPRGDPVIDRGSSRGRDADRFALGDVLVARDWIA